MVLNLNSLRPDNFEMKMILHEYLLAKMVRNIIQIAWVLYWDTSWVTHRQIKYTLIRQLLMSCLIRVYFICKFAKRDTRVQWVKLQKAIRIIIPLDTSKSCSYGHSLPLGLAFYPSPKYACAYGTLQLFILTTSLITWRLALNDVVLVRRQNGADIVFPSIDFFYYSYYV